MPKIIEKSGKTTLLAYRRCETAPSQAPAWERTVLEALISPHLELLHFGRQGLQFIKFRGKAWE